MEQINTIQLGNPNIYPDKAVLKSVLGGSFGAYEKLLELFQKYGLSYEWRYYKDGKAWLCKVQKKKRTIVWMSACDGYMKATVYFPEKHIPGIFELNLDEAEKSRISEGKNVGKSKPCMFDVQSESVLAALEQVIQYKISAK